MTPLHFLETLATQQRLSIIQALRKHGSLGVKDVEDVVRCSYTQASKALLDMKRSGIVLSELVLPPGRAPVAGGRRLSYRLRPEMADWYDLTLRVLGVISQEALRGA